MAVIKLSHGRLLPTEILHPQEQRESLPRLHLPKRKVLRDLQKELTPMAGIWRAPFAPV